MKRALIFLTTAACLVSTSASAQRANELRKGVRVRVTQAQGGHLVGTYLGSEMDSVSLLEDGIQTARRSVAESDVSRIEISGGRHRGKGAVLKGLIGFGVGAASGAILGAVTYTDPKPQPCTPAPGDYYGLSCAFSNYCILVCSKSGAAGFGGLLGGLGGLLVGTFVGLATGHESWTPVTHWTSR